ncbi:MAG: aminotransferase class I/II-fold pyridoxal phosphate-dependent enzyme [Bacilli bacterium]
MNKHFISQRYKNFNMTAMCKSNDLTHKYDDIIDLSLGDTDLKTPDTIINKAMKDAIAGHTHYTDFYGDMELRKEISKFYKNKYNIEINTDEIMITTSGSHGMWLALESILNDNDEVIIHEPFFTPYPHQIKLARGNPIYLPTYEEERFEVNVKRLEKLITKKTKAIIINTPNNPTGTCFSNNKMKDILEISEKYDLLIISDEIYTTFSYKQSFSPMIKFPSGKKRTITINSFSKNYSMTGWRIGNIIAPSNIIEVMRIVNENSVFTAPSVSQRAALYALKLHEIVNPPIVKEIRKRMQYAYDRILSIPNINCPEPEGSIYLFPNIKNTGLTSAEVCNILFEKAHILALPGSAFGDAGEGYIRLAMSVDLYRLEEAFNRMENIEIFN